MTKVYIVQHDDRWYDMGESFVRGVYGSPELAQRNIDTLTPSGRPSKAYRAHSKHCCAVDEWDVDVEATEAVMPDPPPPDPNAMPLLSEAVLDAFANEMLKANPYRLLVTK